MSVRFSCSFFLLLFPVFLHGAETVEPIKYGDMEQWVTRNIKESLVIGGKHKQVYAIGPEAVVSGNEPYSGRGGSPWATSNVMAKVAGVTKASNAVFPESRPGGGRCAKLCTMIESCKALGIINVDVLVAGTLFLGKMIEPVTGTSDPYSKMEMGVPFSRRPTALVYDYSVEIPPDGGRVCASGFSKKRTLKGHDKAEVLIFLQRRWEDADGNIYAKRVGTGYELLSKSSGGWVPRHRLNVSYGDITGSAGFCQAMGLIPQSRSYYARNANGRMVPVHEVGWDAPDAVPTHIIVVFSAASGEPYVGTPGLTLRIDNVGLAYDK